MIKKGTRCIIITDDCPFYKRNEIVYTLEEDYSPFVVKEEFFNAHDGSCNFEDYAINEFYAIPMTDIKEHEEN